MSDATTSATFLDRVFSQGNAYISYAVPFFFALIFLELVIGWLAHRRLYRLNDSINDLSCGVLDQVLRVFLELVLFSGYIFVFDNFRLFEVEKFPPAARWAAAGLLVLGVDFGFYWFHRFAHEWAAPWAAHVVHHQSEEYNLAVALRQSALESCFAWIFYLPLALLGFPPLWYISMAAINLLYQFWIHTRVIGKLGPLEWVFNTPSHHRVHHGRNLKYLDKNYAGMFIIWDRLFGTFQAEEEEVVYGITKPLASWNPLWANVQMWAHLGRLAWQAPYWSDKLRIWFMPLGWTPRGLPPQPRAQDVTPQELKKFNPRIPARVTAYAVFQFLVVLVVANVIMLAADRHAPRRELIIPSLFVLWSLVNIGGFFELRRWAFWSELPRITVLAAGIAMVGIDSSWRVPSLIAGLVVITLSLVWLVGCLVALAVASDSQVKESSVAAASAVALAESGH
ncbi:MAG: sterol desaturase family protein [Pirellulales bacterium]|nr:sterol desaturase family protein [Pirellulales bacterium]